MKDEKYIAVIDETGSNRPQEKDFAFGVAAVLFPMSAKETTVKASKEIGDIVGKRDYKYKHVRESDAARTRFLRLFNADDRRIRCYGFFTTARSVAEAQKRNEEAQNLYAKYWEPEDVDDEGSVRVTEQLLREFVKYMAGNLIAHAVTHQYSLDVYWDDRSDFSIVQDAWDEQLATTSGFSQYSNAPRLVRLAGQAKGDLNGIARLAGAVAGDLSAFFQRHGHRIWSHLDPSGLRGDIDPIFLSLTKMEGPPCVHTTNEQLADSEPEKARDGVPMLQGYYKSFLESDPHGHRLITFGSPYGQYGILRIEHGKRWHIHQLPD